MTNQILMVQRFHNEHPEEYRSIAIQIYYQRIRGNNYFKILNSKIQRQRFPLTTTSFLVSPVLILSIEETIRIIAGKYR